jgi:hypothetical protein
LVKLLDLHGTQCVAMSIVKVGRGDKFFDYDPKIHKISITTDKERLNFMSISNWTLLKESNELNYY